MGDDEKEPTPQELAEAAALARALEEGRAGGGPPAPEDALAAAALVRLRGLDRARAQVVLDRVVAARRQARRRRAWMILAPLGALAAAAVLALGLTAPLRRHAPAALRSATLPRPSTALIEAQLQAAHGQPAPLDAEMRSYRRALYGALASRYGGGQ
ncbi:MAG TPA: hypothetical protein VKN99_02795 [Polyangia bacterium]|nr:hypothetical protein [Polyangia bacterium]